MIRTFRSNLPALVGARRVGGENRNARAACSVSSRKEALNREEKGFGCHGGVDLRLTMFNDIPELEMRDFGSSYKMKLLSL